MIKTNWSFGQTQSVEGLWAEPGLRDVLALDEIAGTLQAEL